jgi:hypothetical protein
MTSSSCSAASLAGILPSDVSDDPDSGDDDEGGDNDDRADVGAVLARSELRRRRRRAAPRAAQAVHDLAALAKAHAARAPLVSRRLGAWKALAAAARTRAARAGSWRDDRTLGAPWPHGARARAALARARRAANFADINAARA